MGIAGAAACLALVGVLHVVPPSSLINPWRRTISEYALHDQAWVFNLALAALALGSLAILVALVVARIVPPGSAAALALAVWSASLFAVIVFPKHNWSLGPSVSGHIHRGVSAVGFLALPLGAGLVAYAWRHGRWRRYAYGTLALSVLSLLAFSPIAVAFLQQPLTGIRWWRVFPLGTVERVLALCEVATVIALGWWAARAHHGESSQGRLRGTSSRRRQRHSSMAAEAASDPMATTTSPATRSQNVGS